MSDIFISYKREDQPAARKLADALEKRDWSVWWDPEIRSGERFDDVIEKALIDAKCVLVIWSKLSVKSRYVKDEATYALNRNKLVPIAIEKVDLPFRFEGIQTGELIDWDGSESSPDYQKLIADIVSIIGATQAEDSGKTLRFVDPIHPDLISVTIAVNAFKEGEQDFYIIWPDKTQDYVNQLRNLIKEAENYLSEDSKFFKVEAKHVTNFFNFSKDALKQAQPILCNAENRVLPLLKGMKSYWADSTQDYEQSLYNFLILSNIKILKSLIYPLRMSLLHDDYFPKEFDSWYTDPEFFSQSLSKFFGFHEPVCRANLLSVSGENISEYIYGPKSLILDVSKNFGYDQLINTRFFVDYLIPQVELMLALKYNNKIIHYNGTASINKAIDENNDEIIGYYKS
jgi:hypothetical protein